MPVLENGQRHHWFKLGGKAKANVEKILELGQKGQKLSDEFNQDQRMAIYKSLGVNKPSLQIMVNGDHTEAHYIWPEIFDGLDQDDDNFYMSVPYDYKNQHFVPKDSEPLDEETQKDIEQRAGAAWGQKIPVIFLMEPRMLNDVPGDFDKDKHDFAKGCSVCSTNFKIPNTKPESP